MLQTQAISAFILLWYKTAINLSTAAVDKLIECKTGEYYVFTAFL